MDCGISLGLNKWVLSSILGLFSLGTYQTYKFLKSPVSFGKHLSIDPMSMEVEPVTLEEPVPIAEETEQIITFEEKLEVKPEEEPTLPPEQEEVIDTPEVVTLEEVKDVEIVLPAIEAEEKEEVQTVLPVPEPAVVEAPQEPVVVIAQPKEEPTPPKVVVEVKTPAPIQVQIPEPLEQETPKVTPVTQPSQPQSKGTTCLHRLVSHHSRQRIPGWNQYKSRIFC